MCSRQVMVMRTLTNVSIVREITIALFALSEPPGAGQGKFITPHDACFDAEGNI